jgi:hypothetical protein
MENRRGSNLPRYAPPSLEISTYRPISLFFNSRKVVMLICLDKKFLLQNNVLSPEQHGYRDKNSTTLLLRISYLML